MRTRLLTAAALAILTAVPLAGQRGARGPARGFGADGGSPGAMLERQVEAALDRREALDLTEAQVADLEALRGDLEATLAPIREELRELRSEARDRSGTRDEVRDRMAALRDRRGALQARLDTLRSPLQARFEQTVSPLQRQELRRSAAPDRRGGAGVARRGSGRGSVGVRGVRGPRGVAAPRAGSRPGGPGLWNPPAAKMNRFGPGGRGIR